MELDGNAGGNAAAGHNPVSAYPWGAHYLPVPDVRNRKLLDFLEETGTLTGYAPGEIPIYSDYHLCAAPDERLSINGHWQDGLVPAVGLSANEQAQTARFFRLVERLKTAVGHDAFRITLDASSADGTFRQLDQISFADYLTQEGYSATPLRWYLNYTCRDDYGASAAQVSAWAGLHYFACRKGRAHNATGGDMLTWPEGNHFLAKHLRRQASTPLQTNTLAYDLRETPAAP